MFIMSLSGKHTDPEKKGAGLPQHVEVPPNIKAKQIITHSSALPSY
jgi:hypothetical protein